MTAFVALLTSLPTGNSTIRMRVWRSLKTTGCAVLRDGVYVLPQAAPQAATLAEAEAAVRTAGGFAMTTELSLRTPAQSEYVHKLFDRSEEYRELVARIGAARAWPGASFSALAMWPGRPAMTPSCWWATRPSSVRSGSPPRPPGA